MIADLHTHTRHSFDSVVDPREAVRVARKKGLTSLAITDHGSLTGALEAASYARGTDLQIIVGEEIATDVCDLVGLFLENEVARGPVERVAEDVRRQGGIVSLPHPYRGHKSPEALVRWVDVVEGFNARTSPRDNAAGQALARAHGKPSIAVSDAHFLREIGNARVTTSSSDLKEALLRGDFSIVTAYNPAYLFAASQLIKSFRLQTYATMPKQLGWIFASLVRRR